MEQKPTSNIGYKLGYIMGATFLLCLNAALVAVTVKFIFWLFNI